MAGSSTLRLGTRPSLLAMAQSRQTAAALQARNPELKIELVDITTRGDRDLQTPLDRTQDAAFFSAELDAALLDGRVDFCVHSWKDIVSDRPTGLIHAATPVRAHPHDVCLFRSDIAARLNDSIPLLIGTSSQRRRINVQDFLQWALPHAATPPRIEFADLRGAVDARLARISPAAGAAQLDGVVLALAGLQRLHADTTGRLAIAAPLATARWMVLPLASCPTAAAQGALALECRIDDGRTRALLRTLHDAATDALVRHELEHSSTAAGVSLEQLGATAVTVAEVGHVLWTRGRHAERLVETVHSGSTPPRPAPPIQPWRAPRATSTRTAHIVAPELEPAAAVFFAHADALQDMHLPPTTRAWTSGPASWRRLARRGIWVEGCGDNLGFAHLCPLLAEPVLALPPLADWSAVTHTAAVDGWNDSGIGTVLGTYTLEDAELGPAVEQQIAASTHFYWSSARQYQHLQPLLPPAAHHACGTGKTLHALRAAGLHNVQPFASRQEWQIWLA
jgi:hydroxymethylbilane synthase